jgi:hypothetical protein
MAERPIFVPTADGDAPVREIPFQIVWSPGFAPVQKAKNIKALHEAAARAGYLPLLEVSTKSEEKLGRHLSAFHLKVRTKEHAEIPLESAFQGSKVFEAGGPYTDLYEAEPRAAKRDPRLRDSGPLLRFTFEGFSFPLQPKTVFYDWLYITAIFPHRDWLVRLQRYAGFTDIEFNPQRSLNCQARSCALFVSLTRRQLLDKSIESPKAFVELMSSLASQPSFGNQGSMFPK